jgi:hypothetical protein
MIPKAVERRLKDIGTIKIHFHTCSDDALEKRRAMVEPWKFSAVVGCLREMKEWWMVEALSPSPRSLHACGVTITVAKHNNKHCGFEQHSFSSRQTHAYSIERMHHGNSKSAAIHAPSARSGGRSQ